MICVPAQEKTKDSSLDPRFGRCSYFLFFDEEGNFEEAISNEGKNARRGAGMAASQRLIEKNTDILIVGNIGPNAFQVISQSGIKIYSTTSTVSAQETVQKYQDGELTKVESPTGGAFRKGQGRGRGQGKGRGRNLNK